MAEDYDNTNKGVLFKVANKKSERHADYNGSIDINGTEFWLSGWINEAKSGAKYLKLSLGDEKVAKGEKKKDQSVPFD